MGQEQNVVVKNKDYIVVFGNGDDRAYYTNNQHAPISIDINDAFPLQLTMASEIADIYKDTWDCSIYKFEVRKVLTEKVEPVDCKALKQRLEELNKLRGIGNVSDYTK